MPELVDTLEIAGCIVTLDAIHCQAETAETIIEKETTSKGSLKGWRKKAGWDNDYLLKVLTG